jgi:adenosine deaminase/adenosine deaminase CECR1
MQIKTTGLLIALAFAGSAMAASPKANEAATARHYAKLVEGGKPQMAGLTLFMTRLPKGGDLHHHYSGSVYAETYINWVDRMGLCINTATYRIETDKAVVEAQRALPAKDRTCLSGADVAANDTLANAVLQRWSSKDFHNHGQVPVPSDRQFFDTFGYFSAPSNQFFNDGLKELKQRALAENLAYIETMFKMAPPQPIDGFDAAIKGLDDKALDAYFAVTAAALQKDAGFHQRAADFVAKVRQAHEGIDDANFTMRYQTYVLRLLPPSMVFSSMLNAFQSAAASNGLIVGINVVGQESNNTSMRDYSLHMKMFRFMRARYPEVKVAMHAGELALGMVPPEGLKFHIDEAINVAGAQRIGHGMDLAHESNALALMKQMREKNIPVEVNLTSNEFILGIKDAAHPVTLFRKHGVPFVISSDDAGVSRNNLSNEYVLFASRYQPSYAEIKKVSYDGIRHAFLPEAEKARLAKQLDQRFAAFEAEIASVK